MPINFILFICITFSTVFFSTNLLANQLTESPEKIHVITTIKPIYNLAAAIMHNTSNTKLEVLLNGNASPHDYALKLREVEAIKHADLIIWIGEDLEFFLVKLFKQPDIVNKLLTIQNLPKIKKLPLRNTKGGNCGHSHNSDCDRHEHKDHNEHNNKVNQQIAVNRIDEHLWLSPENAKIIINAITKVLIKLDPTNANKYLYNKQQFLMKLAKTDILIRNKLFNVIKQRYLVFHDAYQYFEKFYGLQQPLVISDNPAIPLSIQRMITIHNIIKKDTIKCIFKEPQFTSKILDSFLETSKNDNLRIDILDPLGSDQDLGPDGYINLINNIASKFATCFSVD